MLRLVNINAAFRTRRIAAIRLDWADCAACPKRRHAKGALHHAPMATFSNDRLQSAY